MENLINLGRVSRNEMYDGENFYSFIKENLHTTQEIVKFYSSSWHNYLPIGSIPKNFYSQAVWSLVEAWENKEEYLKKILTPSNIRKMINGDNKNVSEYIALSSPFFISSKADAVNGVSGCLACELESFDFSKINHSDKLDSRFYDLLVGLTAMQLIKQKNNADLHQLNLDPLFAASVLKEMDKIIKAEFSNANTSDTEKNDMVFFFGNYVNLINSSNKSEKYYTHLNKEFLSQEAYADGWTGNYTHLILYTSLEVVVEHRKDDALVSFKNKFEYLRDKCMHSEVAVKNEKNEDLEIYLKDLLMSSILPFTTSHSKEEDLEKLQTIISSLNKEFSYLKNNPSSIEKMFISLENYKLEKTEFFIEDRVNDLIDFFDFNVVKKVANNRGYAPDLVAKKIINDVLDKGDSTFNNNLSEGASFKI